MTNSFGRVGARLLAATMPAMLGAACSVVSGLDEYRLVVYEPAPVTTTTGAGAAGGAGGSISGAGGAGQGGAGQGGQGGQGGSTPVALMGDDALVVRYFINEADGMGGLTLHDVPPPSATPLDLPVTLDGMQPSLVQDVSHWAQSWTATNSAGRPTVPITGNKLVTGATSLDGSKVATIELVLKVTAVNGAGSYLFSIAAVNGLDIDDSFSLRATSTSALQFLWNASGGGDPPSAVAGAWQNLDLSTRQVVHMVLDTTSATAAARVQLYVNGMGATPDAFTPPAQNKTIELTAAVDALTLGNDPDGGKSFAGVLYYAALYNKALTAAEIVNNTTILTAGDDGP